MDDQVNSRRQFLTVAAIGAVGVSGCLGDDEQADEYSIADQPTDAAATFVAPEEGAAVTSPVLFEADVEGVELAPAGDAVAGEGHLHLVINGGPFEVTQPFETGEVIPGPADEIEDEQGIFHLSDGGTEIEVELEPGGYTATLQLADGPHRAFGQPGQISFTVEE